MGFVYSLTFNISSLFRTGHHNQIKSLAGRSESGEFLAQRISQLGHPKLSSWLSRRVSEEEERIVDKEFFHFRRTLSRDEKRNQKQRNIIHHNKLKAKDDVSAQNQSYDADPWSKWRYLAVAVGCITFFLAACLLILGLIPKEECWRFRHHFYVRLCGWKREPPPEDFHYLCI